MTTARDLREREDGSKRPDQLSTTQRPPFHRCNCCGAEYSKTEWERLHHCGTQLYEYHDGGADEMLEHRDCPCGSTMAVDLYATGDLERPKREPRHPKLLKALEDAQRAGDHELATRLLRELDEKNRRND